LEPGFHPVPLDKIHVQTLKAAPHGDYIYIYIDIDAGMKTVKLQKHMFLPENLHVQKIDKYKNLSVYACKNLQIFFEIDIEIYLYSNILKNIENIDILHIYI
jgi:archaellin